MEVRIEGLEVLLRRIIREELDGAGSASRDGWLNSQEAADHLGVSRGQLHNLVSAGRLPRHGEKGQRLRFRRADLDTYVEERRS